MADKKNLSDRIGIDNDGEMTTSSVDITNCNECFNESNLLILKQIKKLKQTRSRMGLSSYYGY